MFAKILNRLDSAVSLPDGGNAAPVIAATSAVCKRKKAADEKDARKLDKKMQITLKQQLNISRLTI